MAVMGKEQKDLEKLGSKLAFFQEGVSIRNAHSKVFNFSLLTVMLPQAILLLVALFFTYRNLPESFMPSKANFDGIHLLVWYFCSLRGGSPVAALDAVRVLLALAVGTILFQAVLGLSLSATVYAVRLHYDGQPFCFLDLLRASTPYLWIRFFLTNAYCYVLMFSILIGQTVGVILLIQSKVAIPWVVFGVTVLVGLSLAGEYFLGIIFTIASGVAVLDEEYGWAAVNKSLKLLKGNVKLAVSLQLEWLFWGVVELEFQNALHLQFIQGDFSGWALYVIVVYLAWTSFVWQMRALRSGVQYMSFKAYHDEKGSDFPSEKQTMEGKYERIGETCKVALQGGQQTETVV